MQDRVFYAANILINRQPVIGNRAVCRLVFPRGGKACIVPGRIDKCIHRVGFATRFATAFRAVHMTPCCMTIKRISRTVKLDIIRQLDRQISTRHRIDATAFAMDHRDWATPIALTRNTPVAQTELHFALGLRTTVKIGLFKTIRDIVESCFRRHAIEEA